ncbi:ABC transporter ATP-binding protein [Usitatibacter palustris]|uniref:Putative ABC transporter ATP-binding protein YknY n=1 Tax=Usitatibacter palustris TaxID=2732487 RepID=A0A6M4H965_9PROT|nr:ABC transporter ATP-binding protein [Usitatibacter palustris]QJR14577.1 putative ABC transporter ATP-binding protein YknY [Usitatibacter palustris]
MAERFIEVANLGKVYETAAPGTPPALENVSLSIEAGEFVAVMGPSGSGKSTFMNILGLLDAPTSGSYRLNGQDVAGLETDDLATTRNKVFGFVFQGFNLLKRVTAGENVALPLMYAGMGRSARRERAKEVLAQMGLEKYVDSLPSRLSGGQQQRVAIARALANRPQLILADEPTGNLDTKTSEEIMTLLVKLNQDTGVTIVLVTHENDIAQFAQRLIRFKDGHVVHDGAVIREDAAE